MNASPTKRTKAHPTSPNMIKFRSILPPYHQGTTCAVCRRRIGAGLFWITLYLIPPIIAFLLLAAHFFRSENLVLV